jgi:hypothetical protein
LRLRAEPANAEIVLDDLPSVRGRLDRPVPDDGARHTLQIAAPGHQPRTIALAPNEAPPPEVRLVPLAAAPQPVRKAKDTEKVRRRASEAAEHTAPPALETPKRGNNNSLIIR